MPRPTASVRVQLAPGSLQLTAESDTQRSLRRRGEPEHRRRVRAMNVQVHAGPAAVWATVLAAAQNGRRLAR